MRRSTLTALFVFALSGSLFGIAAADETVAAAPTSGTTASVVPASNTGVASNVPSPNSAAPGVPPSADASEAAAPTAGADLSMWNAAPAAASGAATAPAGPALTPEAPAEPVKHVSRLRRFASGIVTRSSAIVSSLTRSAMRFIGTPYVFGGTRSTGFDCSGYVQHVFALLGVHLPRTADAQFDVGHHITAAMKPGDLVFFHTYAPGVSHVGIYLGKTKFIHSSSSHGVSISSLHDRYWAPRYVGAKRVFGS